MINSGIGFHRAGSVPFAKAFTLLLCTPVHSATRRSHRVQQNSKIDWDIVRGIGGGILAVVVVLGILALIPWVCYQIFGENGLFVIFLEWSIVGTWSFSRKMWPSIRFMIIGTFCGLLFWALMALSMWAIVQWPETGWIVASWGTIIISCCAAIGSLITLYFAMKKQKDRESDRPSDSEIE